MLRFLWDNQISLSVTWADPLLWAHCSVIPGALTGLKQIVITCFLHWSCFIQLYLPHTNCFAILKSVLVYFCKSCVSKSAHTFLSFTARTNDLWCFSMDLGRVETNGYSRNILLHLWYVTQMKVTSFARPCLILRILDRLQLIKM